VQRAEEEAVCRLVSDEERLDPAGEFVAVNEADDAHARGSGRGFARVGLACLSHDLCRRVSAGAADVHVARSFSHRSDVAARFPTETARHDAAYGRWPVACCVLSRAAASRRQASAPARRVSDRRGTSSVSRQLRSREREDRNGQQRRVDRAGLADRQRSDGTPPGICTIDSSESIPFSAALSTGTPSTGSVVCAATIPADAPRRPRRR
jgi:hypothetical protein